MKKYRTLWMPLCLVFYTPLTATAQYCPDGEFTCTDGQCIEYDRSCDGREDCSDGIDEYGCEHYCSDEEFTCTDGQCIGHKRACDGEEDCSDGSDEYGCDGPLDVSIFGPLHLKPNQNVNLSCIAYGTFPGVNYTWSGITCVHIESLTNGSTCSFTPSESDDNKTVTCVAINRRDPRQSRTATYNISIAGKISSPSAKVIVKTSPTAESLKPAYTVSVETCLEQLKLIITERSHIITATNHVRRSYCRIIIHVHIPHIVYFRFHTHVKYSLTAYLPGNITYHGSTFIYGKTYSVNVNLLESPMPQIIIDWRPLFITGPLTSQKVCGIPIMFPTAGLVAIGSDVVEEEVSSKFLLITS